MAFQLNNDSIARVFRNNGPMLTGYADSLMGTRLRRRVDADDIIQAAYVTATLSVGTFTGTTEEDAVRWAVAIVYNEVRNSVSWHMRTMQRDARREQVSSGVAGGEEWTMDFAGREVRPEHRAEVAESFAAVESEIRSLPQLQAQALFLRYRDGLSLKETAEAMGTTTMAIDGLTRRGLKLVRDRLADRMASLVD